MRFNRVCVFVLLVFAVPIFGQTQSAQEEIAATETRWDNAFLTNDKAVLEEVLADDFVLTDSDGNLTTKRALIDGLKPSEKKQIKSNHTEDVRIRVYGDTAVVTGRYVESGIYDSKPYQIESRYTDVYVRRGHAWRGVAAHASGQKITLDGKPYPGGEDAKKQ
jgi:ketosteroid isomerase-like protein